MCHTAVTRISRLLLQLIVLVIVSWISQPRWAEAQRVTSSLRFRTCREMQVQLATAQGAMTATEYDIVFRHMQNLPDLNARRHCVEDLVNWGILTSDYEHAREALNYLQAHQAEFSSAHYACLDAAQLIGAEALTRSRAGVEPEECHEAIQAMPRLQACAFDPMDQRVARHVIIAAAEACRDHALAGGPTHPIMERLLPLHVGGMEDVTRLYGMYASYLPWGAADAILMARLERMRHALSQGGIDESARRVYQELIVQARNYLERIEEERLDNTPLDGSAGWPTPLPTELIVSSAILALDLNQRLVDPRAWCQQLEVLSVQGAQERSTLDQREQFYPAGQELPFPYARAVVRSFIPEQPEVVAVHRTDGRRYLNEWCTRILGRAVQTVFPLPPASAPVGRR